MYSFTVLNMSQSCINEKMTIKRAATSKRSPILSWVLSWVIKLFPTQGKLGSCTKVLLNLVYRDLLIITYWSQMPGASQLLLLMLRRMGEVKALSFKACSKSIAFKTTDKCL